MGGKSFYGFSFRHNVTISDHIPYNFMNGSGNPARELSRYFREIFCEHKFLRTTNKHGRKRILWFFILPQCHDLWPHPLKFHEWKWWPCQRTQHVFQCWNDIKRLPHLPNVWVNVSKELPCQREQVNSEDPFRCFYNKISQFSIELLIRSSMTMCSASSTCQQKIVRGRNFHR